MLRETKLRLDVSMVNDVFELSMPLAESIQQQQNEVVKIRINQ